MIKAKRILIPTDFSHDSEIALQHGVRLAERTGAKIYVMHVQAPSQKRSLPELLAEIERDANEKLNVVTGKVRSSGIEAEAVHAVGNACSSIVSTAKKLEIDLIILSARGFRGRNALIFGYTAEKVVRLAHCPVLTVNPPDPGIFEFAKRKPAVSMTGSSARPRLGSV